MKLNGDMIGETLPLSLPAKVLFEDWELNLEMDGCSIMLFSSCGAHI